MKRVVALLFVVALFAGVLGAQEKKVMHCFTFTPLEAATAADWDAFYQATHALVGKIPGLTHVWAGKLRNPQKLLMPEERDNYMKVQKSPDGEKMPAVNAVVAARVYGACMEMTEAAFAGYAADPAHKDWEKVYSKVRKPGTTTFDIMTQ